MQIPNQKKKKQETLTAKRVISLETNYNHNTILSIGLYNAVINSFAGCYTLLSIKP